jgi:hypothetical protein
VNPYRDTFDYLPPAGKRYRKIKIEADENAVTIKIGRETIVLSPHNDRAFMGALQRAADARWTLRYMKDGTK